MHAACTLHASCRDCSSSRTSVSSFPCTRQSGSPWLPPLRHNNDITRCLAQENSNALKDEATCLAQGPGRSHLRDEALKHSRLVSRNADGSVARSLLAYLSQPCQEPPVASPSVHACVLCAAVLQRQLNRLFTYPCQTLRLFVIDG